MELNLDFSTKPGIRDLTNESYSCVAIAMVKAAAQEAHDLVEQHGQETARKVGHAVVKRCVSQTMAGNSNALVAAFDQIFEALISGDNETD